MSDGHEEREEREKRREQEERENCEDCINRDQIDPWERPGSWLVNSNRLHSFAASHRISA